MTGPNAEDGWDEQCGHPANSRCGCPLDTYADDEGIERRPRWVDDSEGRGGWVDDEDVGAEDGESS